MLSRVADSLYWLSRYLERAEHIARVLDVNLNLMLDQPAEASQQRLRRMMIALRCPIPADEPIDLYALTEKLTFDATRRDSIVGCINAARENARQVREEISSEMWEQLNLVFLAIKATTMESMWSGQPSDFFRAVKEGAQLFQGITYSTMNQGEGLQFLEVGRFLERAVSVAAWLDTHFRAFEANELISAEYASGSYIDWLGVLKSCTAFESYCKVYTADLRPSRVAEFLLLNPEFPHSVRFSIDRLQAALAAIAEYTKTPRTGRVNRLAGKLRAALSYAQIDEIMTSGLPEYCTDLKQQGDQLHTAIYQIYVSYPIETPLTA